MTGPSIEINANLRLISPDVDRDVTNGLRWMNGEIGRKTQRHMGVAPNDVHDHTSSEEQNLVDNFIKTNDELVWMIQYHGQVVGVVEVGLKIPQSQNGPSISIMIGDIEARGKGLGSLVMSVVINYLRELGYEEVNARYLTKNRVSEQMNAKLDFSIDGATYVDEDGLEWQNVKKVLIEDRI